MLSRGWMPLTEATMRPTATILVLMLTAITSALGVAEKLEIRVRLIDALTGKPYAERHAELIGTNTPPGHELHANEIAFDFQTKTGPDGVAHFQIAAPLPDWLIVEALQNSGCAWHGAPPIRTQKVLRTGYIGPNECARKNQHFRWQDIKPKPGEILIFVVEPRGPW